MNITNYIDVINEARNTKGTKAKLEILQRNKDALFLSAFLHLCFDPKWNYYVDKHKFEEIGGLIAPTWQEVFPGTLPQQLDWFIPFTSMLHNRQVTGNAAREYINRVYTVLNAEGRQALAWLLNRNPGMGVAEKGINTVWPELIRIVPYQRCLSGEWGIECEDGIHRTIKQIVEEKYTGGVKSFDQTTGRVCFSPVVGHFDNGMTDDWIIIEYEENGERHFTKALTPQHKVFLADGQEVEAGSLKPGQALFSF